MAQIIQFPSKKAADELRVRIDGRFFRIGVQWNTRLGFWTRSFWRDDGVALWLGLRFTIGVNWLRSMVGPDYPTGALVAVDTTGKWEAPGRLDLVNGRVQLVHLTAEEVASAD